MRRSTVVPTIGNSDFHLTNRKIASSLFLQQLLYYNIFWSIGWLLAFGYRVYMKYGKGWSIVDKDVVRTVLTTFWLLAEPIRLYLGYYGNLQENVPCLAIFVVLTLAPQFPVCYYLMLATYRIKAFDEALQVVMAAFLILGVIAGCAAIRKMMKLHRHQFYLYEYALKNSLTKSTAKS